MNDLIGLKENKLPCYVADSCVRKCSQRRPLCLGRDDWCSASTTAWLHGDWFIKGCTRQQGWTESLMKEWTAKEEITVGGLALGPVRLPSSPRCCSRLGEDERVQHTGKQKCTNWAREYKPWWAAMMKRGPSKFGTLNSWARILIKDISIRSSCVYISYITIKITSV
jgi:hypothetical protein